MAKILLVDDSSFQRKNTAKMLTEMGHQVTTTENGQTGLDLAESDQPDLIITDIQMPVMDGISFLRALQKRGLLIPTIVASADIQETTRDECLALGAKAFLTKPVKPTGLEQAISEALGMSTKEGAGC